MKDNYKRNRRILIGGLVSVLIIILAISLGFLIYGRIYSAELNILVAPSIATVKVGDAEFSPSGNYKMMPGEYAVEIKAEGFETKTGKIVLSADKTSELHLYLNSNDESTANWYETHAEDALIVGEIQNAETLKMVNKLLEKEPALKEFPLIVEYYSDDFSEYTKYIISYGLDDSDRGFYLIMKDYTGVGMIGAISKMQELGMNTVGVELRYENLSGDSLSGHAE